jgi:predicted AAA+ superfamily ATPase
MAVATFDTLKFANTLKAAGVPPAQAEAQAQAFAEIIHVNFKELVTKDDLDRATRELTGEIDRGAREAKANLDQVAREMKAALDQVAKALEGKASQSALDQMAKDIRRELAEAVERLERKISEESLRTNARIDAFQAKHAGDIALIKWMFGAIVTGVVGILVRLLLFRGP